MRVNLKRFKGCRIGEVLRKPTTHLELVLPVRKDPVFGGKKRKQRKDIDSMKDVLG